MRLRHKPWAKDKINENNHIIIPDPLEQKGSWHKLFGNDNPIHVEIGSGKGQFIVGMAKQNPDVNFIGIEKFDSVIISALDKVLESGLANVKLLNKDAQHLEEFFAENELERVYLNFSDPWPKKRHEKRRLTFRAFLERYEKIMVDGGEIHLKTDNRQLFEYSLVSFSQYGMLLKDVKLDLHHSEGADNVMTEYEEKFSQQGLSIYRCEATFQSGKEQ